jgi:hypothetical protein
VPLTVQQIEIGYPVVDPPTAEAFFDTIEFPAL